MTIWKYPLRLGEQAVQAPEGARLLSAGMQGEALYCWALVDPSRPLALMPVYVCGTGHRVPAPVVVGMEFIGTVFDGPSVWHVFGGRWRG